MKNNLFKALFLGLALSAQAQQSIVCDVAKLNSFPLTITATVDTDVTATILQNGVETPLAGYTGLFYFGDSLGGVTITNSATGYNTYSWTIPAESTPTNGVYSVQILSAKDGRVKELGRGRMTVRANPSTDYIPVQWQTNNMTYMTAALARDIAIHANATASNALVIANQALGNSAIGTNDVLSLSGCLVDAHNTNTASHLDIRQTASNGLANANEALARENVTTNAVNDLSGSLVSNHNVSAVSHADIRASVSNKQDIVDWGNLVGISAHGIRSLSGLSIGTLETTVASGDYSLASGEFSTASGLGSIAFGYGCLASSDYATAFGKLALATHTRTFVWSGSDNATYESRGVGTFNINPVGGASGFYIGETNLQTLLDARLSVYEFASSNAVTQASIDAKPSAESVTNTVFYKQIADSASAVTSTVSVVPSVGIYKVVSTSAVTTVVFDKSALSATSNSIATWETWIDFQYTNSALTLVLSGVTLISPVDITCFGMYKFAMTYDGVTVECYQKYPTVYSWIPRFVFVGTGANEVFPSYGNATSFSAAGTTNGSILVKKLDFSAYEILRFRLFSTDANQTNYFFASEGVYGVAGSTNKELLFSFVGFSNVTFFMSPLIMSPPSRLTTLPNRTSLRGVTLYRSGSANAVFVNGAESRQANELEIKAYNQGWRPFN